MNKLRTSDSYLPDDFLQGTLVIHLHAARAIPPTVTAWKSLDSFASVSMAQPKDVHAHSKSGIMMKQFAGLDVPPTTGGRAQPKPLSPTWKAMKEASECVEFRTRTIMDSLSPEFQQVFRLRVLRLDKHSQLKIKVRRSLLS